MDKRWRKGYRLCRLSPRGPTLCCAARCGVQYRSNRHRRKLVRLRCRKRLSSGPLLIPTNADRVLVFCSEPWTPHWNDNCSCFRYFVENRWSQMRMSIKWWYIWIWIFWYCLMKVFTYIDVVFQRMFIWNEDWRLNNTWFLYFVTWNLNYNLMGV